MSNVLQYSELTSLSAAKCELTLRIKIFVSLYMLLYIKIENYILLSLIQIDDNIILCLKTKEPLNLKQSPPTICVFCYPKYTAR